MKTRILQNKDCDNWDPALYIDKQKYQLHYGKTLIDEFLKPKAGEVILDLGCGTGHITRMIANSGARVIGLDHSEHMIENARKNFPDIEFVIGDAKNFSFPFQFDAVFSTAVLHWIPEADSVIKSVERALKKGGRFVAQFSCKGSMDLIRKATEETYRETTGDASLTWNLYEPTIGEYTSLLESNGLQPNYAVILDHMTELEEGKCGMRIWLDTYLPVIFPTLSREIIDTAIPYVENKLRSQLFNDGKWHADYKRLRVIAIKK